MRSPSWCPSVRCWLVVALLAAPLAAAAAKQEEAPQPARSIVELRGQIEKILADTKTPGVSVAIVHRDGSEWVAGVGLADVAARRPATAQTLFRIGSTSKAFVSLSVLELVREGKLTLDTPLRQVAPEIAFSNRWEATDPVRIVDLLEHTTGWDDIHLRDYAKQAPPEWTTRQGLDYCRSSRVSRWPPGTRTAYCNDGPAVAAYVVEKLTGERFEDFVRERFFVPIGMQTATYFQPRGVPATELYRPDGKTPFPYWNILIRAAGSINASAEDMAAYVRFYLDRGTVDGREIMPASDLDRMETPTRDWAARDGLAAGYGLSNYWSVHEGFVYHGHNGGVDGGLTEMAYLKDAGVGYSFSINSGSADAFKRIGKAIRAYITRDLEAPALPAAAPLPADAAAWAGWYEPDSPRVEMFHFLERLLGLARVRFAGGKLVLAPLLGSSQSYVAVRGRQFRRERTKEPSDPVATLLLFSPEGAGRFVQAGAGMETWRRIPTALALAELVLTGGFVLALVSVVLYLPFWLIAGMWKRRRRPAERALRLWPLAAVASLLATVGIFQAASADVITRLGNLTVYSGGLFLATLAYAVATVASLLVLRRGRGEGVRRGFRRYSAFVVLALAVAALYLAWWGVIGLRTWG